MSWWVYILRCGDGTLYTGTAADVERRLAAHRRGRGAKYTPGPGAAGGGLPGGVSRRGRPPAGGGHQKVPAGGKGSIDFGLCGKAEQDEKSGIYRNGKHGRAPDSGGVPAVGAEQVVIANRTRAKAEALAAELGCAVAQDNPGGRRPGGVHRFVRQAQMMEGVLSELAPALGEGQAVVSSPPA